MIEGTYTSAAALPSSSVTILSCSRSFLLPTNATRSGTLFPVGVVLLLLAYKLTRYLAAAQNVQKMTQYITARYYYVFLIQIIIANLDLYVIIQISLQYF